MFTHYQNILCVHGGWLFGEGKVMSECNYKYHKRKANLRVVNRACKGTPSWVEYETLPARFKRQIEQKVGGHPRQLIRSANTLAKKLVYDSQAARYYTDYRLEDGKHLPEDTQREYTSTASILNTVGREVLALVMRRQKTRSKMAIWELLSKNVASLDTDTWPHNLPTNARRFRDRYKRYKKEGYASLIHKNFTNKNSEKVHHHAAMWLLSRWADQVRRVPNLTHLLAEYNTRSKEQGWKPLKNTETLRHFLYRGDIKHLWYGHRYGDMASKEKFTYQHSTTLPTMRDSLWYGDGTKLNYYYRYQDQEGNWKLGTSTVYEVMDSYSEVFLGFHISKTENYASQYHAFKMAVQTARHRPYQVSVDNQGGHKKLKTGYFLNKITSMAINTTPYNAKSKTIESAFGRFQQQHLKKDWFFTGQNIKSKKLESQQHKEFIARQHIENFPTLPEIVSLYKERRQEWNQAHHHATGQPRIAMYENSHNPQAPPVDELDMVSLFWVLREKPVTMQSYGLTIQENNKKYTYVKMASPGMPDIPWIRKHVDKKFWVRFDPSNMDLINLYEGERNNLRLVTTAETKILLTRGKQEQENWETAYFNRVKQENEKARKAAFDTMENILETHQARAENYGLKTPAMLGVKDSKNKTPKEIAKALKEESYREDTTERENKIEELI